MNWWEFWVFGVMIGIDLQIVFKNSNIEEYPIDNISYEIYLKLHISHKHYQSSNSKLYSYTNST